MTDPYKGRYCKDCRHARPGEYAMRGMVRGDDPIRCGAARVDRVDYDPISGSKERSCYSERRAERSTCGPCGPEGKLWEPIDPTPKTE